MRYQIAIKRGEDFVVMYVETELPAAEASAAALKAVGHVVVVLRQDEVTR